MQAAIDPEINPVIQNFIEQTINGEFAFVFNLKEMHNHVEQYMKFHAFYVSNQEQQEMYFAVITPYNFSDNVFFNVNGSTNCLVVSFNNEEKSLFVGDLSDWGESNDLLRLKGETLKGIFETEEDTIQIKRFEHNDAFVAEVVEPVNPDQTKHKDTPPIKHEGPIERENQHNPARRKRSKNAKVVHVKAKVVHLKAKVVNVKAKIVHLKAQHEMTNRREKLGAVHHQSATIQKNQEFNQNKRIFRRRRQKSNQPKKGRKHLQDHVCLPVIEKKQKGTPRISACFFNLYVFSYVIEHVVNLILLQSSESSGQVLRVI